MASTSDTMFDSRILHGQGKTATTLLTEDGCHYPVIHEPYCHRAFYNEQRSSSAPTKSVKGVRAMHRSTLTIAKPPWSPDYTTTTKQFFSGRTDLKPADRPTPCPSMHRSQIVFGTDKEPDHFRSETMTTYRQKPTESANRLHLLSLTNKLNQNEGGKLKEVIMPDSSPCSYWSQYNRVHNKLGLLRGPGVAREYPVRQQYDIITGKDKGPAWQPENALISGNRVLHSARQQLIHKPLLF